MLSHFALLHRHPELVSGSISRFDRSQRRQAQLDRKVGPMRVRLVDQIDLPRPMPVLELFLAGDCADHVAEHLKMDQTVNLVTRGKPWRRTIAVLPHPAEQIRRNPDIQRAVVSARQNIDARVTLLTHGPEPVAKWTLKQVQGDGNGLGLEISPALRSNSQTRTHLKPRHAELVSASIVLQARRVGKMRVELPITDGWKTLYRRSGDELHSCLCF